MTRKPVSVQALIVTQGRTAWLCRCIKSLTAAAEHCGEVQLSFVLGINGLDTKSSAALDELNLSYVSLKHSTPAQARNSLFAQLSGDWVLFIDDDAFVAPDFFECFLVALKTFPEAGAVGGPNLTHPDSSPFQRVTGEVLSSRFATFLSCARYRPVGAIRPCNEAALILCNLFVKNECLLPLKFPTHIVSAEENWLLTRMAKDGAQLIYAPALWVWHERREGFRALARQVFKYGRGRGQSLRLNPDAIRATHLLPSICLLYTIGYGAALGAGAVPLFPGAALFPAYAALCAWFAATRTRSFFKASLIFPLIHVSYGAGVLVGLTAFTKQR